MYNVQCLLLRLFTNAKPYITDINLEVPISESQIEGTQRISCEKLSPIPALDALGNCFFNASYNLDKLPQPNGF